MKDDTGEDVIGSVYFLIRGDRIKVGFSINVEARLAQFQHEMDDLLATIEGVTMKDERAAHKYLARWKVRGEWFRATPECLDAIQWLVNGGLEVWGAEDRREMAKERTAIARLGANTSWANTKDWSARTTPARRAHDAKFLALADGDPKRAEAMRRAHFQRLALKSAQVRAARKVHK